jgi:hypothetical protein
MFFRELRLQHRPVQHAAQEGTTNGGVCHSFLVEFFHIIPNLESELKRLFYMLVSVAVFPAESGVTLARIH